MSEEHIVLVLVSIVALGVGAQWLAWRIRIPAIVVLAIAGLLAGPGFGLLDPSADFPNLLRPVVSLCVAIILFEGGLSLQLNELKVAARGVQRLVNLGAPLTWVFGSLAAHHIGGLSWPVALVFGAIMVVTGPTVIIPLLRNSALNRRTASYLKWEAIVNDPLGALVAVLLFQFFVYAGEGSGWGVVATGVSLALLSGVFLGGLGGWLTGKAFQQNQVPEYLKSPVMLGLVLVVYALSNSLQHEAGLLAVTVMGIVVGNMNLPGIQDMRRFKEYITVMLVAVVFVLLTADLDPRVIGSIDWRGVALISAILVVVRPLSVMLATAGAGMDLRDRLFLSWIAPRGIVAAATAGVMGPRLFEAGYAGADSLLPLVFGVIFATVFFHGLSITWLAKRLGLASEHRDNILIVGASPWTVELGRTLQQLRVPVLVADNSWHNLRPARLAGLPVFYGEILSDFAEESLEIPHISTVLASTSNDAYNALVCTVLAPEIGRGRTFQLPLGATLENDPRSAVAKPLRGNIAFNEEATFERLWRLHVRGWTFYKTRLTENYSYSDFLRDRPADAMQILVVKSDGRVDFVSSEEEQEPSEGDTVVYYGPERSALEWSARGSSASQT